MSFFEFVNAFTPYITKYVFFSENTCNKAVGIMKSLSGILQNIPYINNKPVYNPISIVKSEKECDFDTKKCEVKMMIIPGYMDYDPKFDSSKKCK